MKQNLAKEFFFQIIALLVAIIVIHAAYVAIVRPQANAILEEQRELQTEGVAYDMEKSLFVTIKDYEQETCFILMLWATAIMIFKANSLKSERNFLSYKLIDLREEMRIVPQDSRKYARHVQSMPTEQQEYLVPRTLLNALQRFASTKSVQDVAQAIKETCETEGERLDSELAIIRYIVWAIPSIGFIGTVRGISQALGQAHRAVEGDIVGVTVSLGVAFNSTFIALVISLFVMFLMHQLQLMQERFVLDTQDYCEKNLLRRLEA
ncbi:MAG: MotA/TolQ/ExbB proton channel family protein [Pseudomonadota bacterium]|nr:MotA/TolQ/ExbB proton channel family protein [Pseudomonadota bacterium]